MDTNGCIVVRLSFMRKVHTASLFLDLTVLDKLIPPRWFIPHGNSVFQRTRGNSLRERARARLSSGDLNIYASVVTAFHLIFSLRRCECFVKSIFKLLEISSFKQDVSRRLSFSFAECPGSVGLLKLLQKTCFVCPSSLLRDYFANLKTEAAWVSEKMRLQLNAKMFKVDFHADAPWHVRDSRRSSATFSRRI